MRALLKRIISRSSDETGQILMLTALMLAVLLGMVALVVDVGNFLRERGHIQSVVDAAALAGAQELPDDSLAAQNKAIEYALANDPTLSAGDLNVQLYCLVGDDDNNGVPDANDIPAACNPGSNATWTCANSVCYSPCFAAEGDKCNVIWVGNDKDVPFFFAPVLGIAGENTGEVDAAACSGSCNGPLTEPLDVVLVLDRTGSMDASELADAKNAAKAVLGVFNPNYQHVALGVLGASSTSNLCNDQSPTSSSSTWLNVPLSNDYKVNGALNNSSQLIQTINCLNTSSQGTNLGSPIQDDYYGRNDAITELLNNGRPDIKDAILFFTDGAANEPAGGSTSSAWYDCTAQSAVTSGSGDNNGFEGSSSNSCGNNGADASDTNSGTGTSTSCTSSSKDRHVFHNFNIGVPTGDAYGIEVRLEDARVDSASGTRRMCVEVSWNGGATWSSAQTTSNLGTSDSDYTEGSTTYNWGHTWSASEFSNSNFRVRVTNVADNTSRDFFIDSVQVRVTGIEISNPCQYAYDMASDAKAADIEIYTLAYGLAGDDCVNDGSGSSYNNTKVTKLLGDMATDSYDETGCDNSTEIAQENGDGDNFFCESNSNNLANIFQAAAEQLVTGSRLVRLP